MAEREGWKQVEAWLVVDADGDYRASADEGEALGLYRDEVNEVGPTRTVCVKVWVELPRSVELCGEAPLVGHGAELVVS